MLILQLRQQLKGICKRCAYENYLCDNDIDSLDEDKLKTMLTYANAAASLVTLKKGALRSMPEKAQIEELVKAR